MGRKKAKTTVSDAEPPVSPAFAAAFLLRAGAEPVLPFDVFVELALYHPSVGYYRRERRRIGRGPATDFMTAASSRPFFGRWVAAACLSLLGEHDSRQYRFVELGAEPEGGVLTGQDHPFASYEALGAGQSPDLSGRIVLFSNELFDAQPFRRFLFSRGQWREMGVALEGGALVERELPARPPSPLPVRAPEGYRFDAPTGSVSLLESLASPRWTGLFLAFDYGKSWRELAEAAPAGTARAYRRHVQSNDLLARPGEQDLTCHICWDWLEEVLTRHGFSPPQLESQEAFLVRHAGSAPEAAGRPS